MPGIGTRTAERLAFYILKLPVDDTQRLADAILKVKATKEKKLVTLNVLEA